MCLVAACSATPFSSTEAVTSGDGPGGAHVIYLNFDGVAVQPASDDDATQNRSAIVSAMKTVPAFDAGPYAAQYTPDQVKNAIASRVAQLFAPFDVLVTVDRPQSGRYTMAVIGGTASALGLPGSGSSGTAFNDCGNQNESNVVFVFSATLSPAMVGAHAIDVVAVTTAKELGRSFGLADTQNNLDVMNTTLSVDAGGNPTATGFASGLHAAVLACAGATQQDSAGLLAANIGFASADGGVMALPDAAQAALDLSSLDESMPIDAAGLDASQDLSVTPGPGSPPVGNPGCSMGGGGAGLPFAGWMLLTLLGRRRAARAS